MVNCKEEHGQRAIKKLKGEASENAKINGLDCNIGNRKEVREVFTGIWK
jgi:hypothetical protein